MIKTVKEQLNSHMTYSTIIHSSLVNPAKPKLKETQDPVDTVTMDVPLLTKILELAREDIKSDTELHDLVSKLVEMKNQGTLTMDQYDQLIHKAEPNVELEAIRKLAGI
jgi:hypothetical protein